VKLEAWAVTSCNRSWEQQLDDGDLANAVSPVGTAQDGAAASDGGPTNERSFLVTAR
jgi:hypothetical protein